jgi:hypothetical protein
MSILIRILILFLFVFNRHIFSSDHNEDEYYGNLFSFDRDITGAKNPRHFFEDNFMKSMGVPSRVLRGARGRDVFSLFFDQAKDLFHQKKSNPDGRFDEEENVLYQQVLGSFSPGDDFLVRLCFLTALDLRDVADDFAAYLRAAYPKKIPADSAGQSVIILCNPHIFFYDMQLNPRGEKENKKSPPSFFVPYQFVMDGPPAQWTAESVGSCDFSDCLTSESDAGDESCPPPVKRHRLT